MDRERWSDVKELYTEASKLLPAERDEFLRQRCGNNAELISEIERLLSSPDGATVVATDPPTGESGANRGDSATRAFAPNQILADRFRILRFIDKGGMGEVYAAEDLQLGRQVAVKTILPDFAVQPGIIERFRREISLSLRITHPNVCRVFDLETHRTDSEDVLFLTMELLEGETLESWMKRYGGVSTVTAAPIVYQILKGLDAAHRVGVIHRDFKPSNVFLVPEPNGGTRAVVMDFGLAFFANARRDVPRGEVAGTPLYMAPEQWEGRLCSVASDIYSVGVVLYEMITGHAPFPVNSKSRVTERKRALLAPKHYRPGIAEHWEKAILQCLSYEPAARPSSVGALIQALRLEPASAQASVPAKRRILALVLAAILVVGVSFWLRSRPGERIEDLTPMTSETDLSADPSLSRDGKTIAYESDRAEPGNQDVWIQQLADGVPRRVTTNPADDEAPNLSPDGSQVVFHSDRNGGGVYIAETKGGPERLLAPFGHRPKFSPDGKQVAFWTGEYDESIPSGRIYVIAASGDSPRRLAPDFIDARYPIWSPDGHWILLTGCRQLPVQVPLSACQDWWVTSLDGAKVFKTGAIPLFRSEGLRVRYWPCGWFSQGVLFSAFSDGPAEIWRVLLSPHSWRVSGKPVQLTSGTLSAVDATLADNATIAFGGLRGAAHIWAFPLLSQGRKKEGSKLTNGPDADVDPSVSRDGRFLVFARGEKHRRSIWFKDLTSGKESELARPGMDNIHPVMSLYGEQVAFEADDMRSKGLYTVAPGEKPTLVCSGCEDPTGWLQHDRAILFTNATTGRIQKVTLASGRVSTVVAKDGARAGDATWSPETEYLLFTVAGEQGNRQIFAAKLAQNDDAAEEEWIPITNGSDRSDNPQWSPDGGTIYFVSNRDNFMCVWGEKFDARHHRAAAPAFAVLHFHNSHSNPDLLIRSDFGLSVSKDAIVLNSGEASETIWRGVWKPASLFSMR
ncbi:MAG: PD40 domain-containing protein [Acidobacteriaceae bacterium]|nr:PD40 domain-containing protein [Acidobacteriaceae bacterium]